MLLNVIARNSRQGSCHHEPQLQICTFLMKENSDKAIFSLFQRRMSLLRQMNLSFTWSFFFCLARTPQRLLESLRFSFPASALLALFKAPQNFVALYVMTKTEKTTVLYDLGPESPTEYTSPSFPITQGVEVLVPCEPTWNFQISLPVVASKA